MGDIFWKGGGGGREGVKYETLWLGPQDVSCANICIDLKLYRLYRLVLID